MECPIINAIQPVSVREAVKMLPNLLCIFIPITPPPLDFFSLYKGGGEVSRLNFLSGLIRVCQQGVRQPAP